MCSELGIGNGVLGVWVIRRGKLLLDVGRVVQLCKHSIICNGHSLHCQATGKAENQIMPQKL